MKAHLRRHADHTVREQVRACVRAGGGERINKTQPVPRSMRMFAGRPDWAHLPRPRLHQRREVRALLRQVRRAPRRHDLRVVRLPRDSPTSCLADRLSSSLDWGITLAAGVVRVTIPAASQRPFGLPLTCIAYPRVPRPAAAAAAHAGAAPQTPALGAAAAAVGRGQSGEGQSGEGQSGEGQSARQQI
jgi:hypothetical protein